MLGRRAGIFIVVALSAVVSDLLCTIVVPCCPLSDYSKRGFALQGKLHTSQKFYFLNYNNYIAFIFAYILLLFSVAQVLL